MLDALTDLAKTECIEIFALLCSGADAALNLSNFQSCHSLLSN
jgi:hypothetical protein